MKTINDMIFDNERALYGERGIIARKCRFEGEADGESAFKECRNVIAEECYFDLRYPFWHNDGLKIINSVVCHAKYKKMTSKIQKISRRKRENRRLLY